MKYDYESEEYHQIRHPELIADKELRFAWSHFADMAYFQSVKEGHAVLEFGGGLGNNLLTVARRAKIWMVEPSSLGREIAAQDGINVAPDLDGLGEMKFDLILCRHVLEHLEHPLQTLTRLCKSLKPGGKLVVAVPCEHGSAMPSNSDIDHHLYSWNPQTLCNLLTVAGFVAPHARFEYYGARRKLMPLYRRFGGVPYAKMVRFVGRLFNFRELVVDSLAADLDMNRHG